MAITDQTRTIRIPIRVTERINVVAREQKRLIERFGREPTNAELVSACDMKAAEIRALKKMVQHPVLFHSRVGDDGDACVGKFLSDPSSADPCEVTERSFMREKQQKTLMILGDRERVLTAAFDGSTELEDTV